MKKIYSSLLIGLFALQLSAQVPGYLGKRTYLKVDAAAFPSFGPSSKNRGINTTYGEKGGVWGLDYRYGLQAGFAYSRYKGLALSVYALKTGLSVETVGFGEDGLFFQLKGKAISLGHQWFHREKGAIAPLGSFFGLHFQGTFLKGEVDKEVTGYTVKNLGFEPKRTYLSLGLEYGHTNIIKDRIFLSYAIQINLPVGTIYDIIDWVDNSSTIYTGFGSQAAINQESFRLSAARRMLIHDLVCLRVGFGLLTY